MSKASEHIRAFISYSRQNLVRVREVVDELRFAGISVWMDVDNLVGGEPWEHEIEAAISESDFFIMCVSSATADETFAHAELEMARTRARRLPSNRRFVIPLILDQSRASQMPAALRRYQAVHISGVRASLPWRRSMSRLLAALGAPPRILGSQEAADYRAITGKYFAHVSWWLIGRTIRPNSRAPKRSLTQFGSAPVRDYMVPFEKNRILVCSPRSVAQPQMMRLVERLFPHPETVSGELAPVVAVLESPGDLRSRFLGIVTPSELATKWTDWYATKKRIAPDVWFEDPVVCSPSEKVRTAYARMGRILTGLPVVDPKTRQLRGFLPHPGTREDLARGTPSM